MKLILLNATVNSGSTGRIAEEIGLAAMASGFESTIAAAYTVQPSRSKVIAIGSVADRKLHGLKTRLFDRHGFGSAGATRRLVKQIAELDPDIIHLHNIHGYYLNIAILFGFLKAFGKPVLWTLHDCWPFTGHCAHFERIGCYKWHEECHHCPLTRGYPASWGIDNSRKNYSDKKGIFNGVERLQIVVPSRWLANHVSQSFLKDYPIKLIHNGIDLDVFNISDNEQEGQIRKKYNLENHKIILGVAGTWKKRKALEDFVKLSEKLGDDERIVLAGLKDSEKEGLPENIIAVARTENTSELAALYSAAAVFVNPTYADTFPTTNIEALACGTPVVTYKTGGSPEAIDAETGYVVEKEDIKGLYSAIQNALSKGKDHYQPLCRARAEKYFDKNERFSEYIDLYRRLLKIN